jgi:hypothetical protein
VTGAAIVRADEDRNTIGDIKGQPKVEDLPGRVSRLARSWRINPDFDRLIGSPVRQDGQKYPKSLRLAFALPDAPVLDDATIALLEDMFVSRMKHTVIATGDWEAEEGFSFSSDRDSKCFVTTKGGATYLWLGTPDESLFGAEVHYVRLDTMRAFLILDSNSMLPPRMRKTNNVAAYSPADRDQNGDRTSKKDAASQEETDVIEAAKAHLRALLTSDKKMLSKSYAAKVRLLPGEDLLDRDKFIEAALKKFAGGPPAAAVDLFLRRLDFEPLEVTEGEFVTSPSPTIRSKDGRLRFQIEKGGAVIRIAQGVSSWFLQLRKANGEWTVVAEYTD